MELYIARVTRRLKQMDLAIITGISQSRLSLLENGYVQPSKTEKELLSEALGLTVDDIQWPDIAVAKVKPRSPDCSM